MPQTHIASQSLSSNLPAINIQDLLSSSQVSPVASLFLVHPALSWALTNLLPRKRPGSSPRRAKIQTVLKTEGGRQNNGTTYSLSVAQMARGSWHGIIVSQHQGGIYSIYIYIFELELCSNISVLRFLTNKKDKQNLDSGAELDLELHLS